jgi:DNA-binding HxlR family transcriptional regulator
MDTISQKNMTGNSGIANNYNCPAQDVVKLLGSKWTPQLFRIASTGPFRFNQVLRELPDASKQSISVALREMEEHGMLLKKTVKLKPLHIEYELTEAGYNMLDVYKQIAFISPAHRPKES